MRRHPSFEEFWETTLDISRNFHDAVLSRPEAEIEEIREGLRERLAALHGRRRIAGDPGPHAGRGGERLSRPLACAPMIYDDDADLRSRRQDRRHHRLRLPGPRPRAQPQGLRRRRRRRPARGLGLRRQAREQGLEVLSPSSRPPAAGDLVMILRARRAPPRGLGERTPRRHRRGQHAAVRPRLLDPLRRDRAARRGRRRDGRAQGPRPPRAPPVHRRQRRPRPDRGRAGRHRQRPRARRWPTPRASAAPAAA